MQEVRGVCATERHVVVAGAKIPASFLHAYLRPPACSCTSRLLSTRTAPRCALALYSTLLVAVCERERRQEEDGMRERAAGHRYRQIIERA